MTTEPVVARPIIAVNAHTFGQAQAIVEAAVEFEYPVTLQISQSDLRVKSGPGMVRGIRAILDEQARRYVKLHLDHGLDFDVCAEAIDLGFDSVMIDGTYNTDGVTPRSYEDNLAVTAQVVKHAHGKGVLVEGALGLVGDLRSCLGGSEDAPQRVGPFARNAFLTDVGAAVAFVDATNVDALAIAIGTVHGQGKFPTPPDSTDFDLTRITELRRALPTTLLVLHGCSSLPDELQTELVRFGGELKEGWGVPHETLADAVRRGVGKINIDTDLRLAMTGAMRRFLAEHPTEVNPGPIEAAGTARVKEVCVEWIDRFSSFA